MFKNEDLYLWVAKVFVFNILTGIILNKVIMRGNRGVRLDIIYISEILRNCKKEDCQSEVIAFKT